MNKTTDVVVLKPSPKALDDCAARVLQNHMLAKNLAQHAVIYAAKCGAELLRAKELCGHGEFLAWCEKHIHIISHRTVTKYMLLAEAMAGKLASSANLSLEDGETNFATVANLPGPASAQVEARYEQIAKLSLLQLPDPRDAKACEKNPELQAFTKATDGRTLTQLYMDFGIIAEPGRAVATARGPVNAAGTLKLKKQSAAERIHECMAAMEAARAFCLVADKPLLEVLERERIKFGHFLAPLLKGKGAGSREQGARGGKGGAR